jgi:hypothetical protein
MSELVAVDALACLVVRLADHAPGDARLQWHRWHEAGGQPKHGLSADTVRRPQQAPPHKKLPTGEWPYYSAHVEGLLFPQEPVASTAHGRADRWLCCPDELRLGLGRSESGVRWARIDLLERLTLPIVSSRSVGLIHLSLASDANFRDDEATLRWAVDLRTAFRSSEVARPQFLLAGELGDLPLRGTRPLRSLVEALFGDPADDLERRLYTILLAAEPRLAPTDDADAETYLRGWRRALARRSNVVAEGLEAERADPEKARRQTLPVGPFTGMVLGRSTALSGPARRLNGAAARNFRSYWSESVVFALLQHDRLELIAERLAALGFDPSSPSLDDLYDEWLAFRNVLWWSQLSTSSDVPQALVRLIRAELGTERLFDDLDGDFSAYTERRRRRLDDAQSRALSNLQVYGAGVATIGTVAAALALVGAEGIVLAGLIGLMIAAGVAASLVVRRQLARSAQDPIEPTYGRGSGSGRR